jgi:ribosomal protein S27AE
MWIHDLRQFGRVWIGSERSDRLASQADKRERITRIAGRRMSLSWAELTCDEESCRKILRWSRAYEYSITEHRKPCPRCAKTSRVFDAERLPSELRWRCSQCGSYELLTSRTFFAQSHHELKTWFAALGLFVEKMAEGKKLKAPQLREALPEVGHFKTAQRMIKTLREKVFLGLRWRGFAFRFEEGSKGFRFQNGALVGYDDGFPKVLARDPVYWSGDKKFFKAVADVERRENALLSSVTEEQWQALPEKKQREMIDRILEGCRQA